MPEKNKKRKNMKLSVKRLLKIGGLLIVCTLAVYRFVDQQIVISKCENEIRIQEQKIAEEKLENQRLEEELEKAGTDEYLERMAREKLGLVKANERVFVDVTND